MQMLITLVPLALKLSIIFVGFGFGLSTTPRAALLVLRQPGQLVRIAAAMNICMPLLALGAAVVFELDPAVKIALVTLAASPVPPVLPKRALKAGGQADYIAGLMVAASLLSIVFIPLILRLCGLVTRHSFEVPTAQVISIIVLHVLAPLMAGMVVNEYLPQLALRWSPRISSLAMGLLLSSFFPVLIRAGVPMLDLLGNGTLLAFAAFAATGLLLGHLLGGPHHEHSTVLAVATATRHPAIALAIAHATYPTELHVAPAVVLYLVVSEFVTFPYFRWLKRNASRNAAHAARSAPRLSPVAGGIPTGAPPAFGEAAAKDGTS
jgi:bile acid:Na+ symporter, BASS family